jgi:hypothetical protein
MNDPRSRLNLSSDAAAVAGPSELPVSVTDQAPRDPELRKLADDVLGALRYSFTAAAAGLPVERAGTADQAFREYVATRRPARRAEFARRARTLLDAAPSTRREVFGRYAGIDAAQYSRTGSDALVAAAGALALDQARLAEVLAAPAVGDVRFIEIPPEVIQQISTAAGEPTTPRRRLNLSGFAQAFDKAQGAKLTRLRLMIKKVRCIKPTSGWGSDEIAMGGLAIDPDGKTRKIGEFMVGTGFLAGKEKVWPGAGKAFAEWKIVANGVWPQVYPSMLLMVEKDNGGFSTMLSKLWSLVKDYVTAALKKAGAALAGALGAIIGAVVGYVLSALVGWIISWWQDDLIQMKPMQLHLGAATASYYAAIGLTAEPPKLSTLNFMGDGGHYRLWYHFQATE